MRVANKVFFDAVKYNLGTITERMAAANEVVSSGKKLNSLSDDPVGLLQALNVKSTIAGIQQQTRNITMAQSWVSGAESALTQAQNIVSESRALAVQLATATVSESERTAAVDMVQGMLDEMVTLANAEVGGRYVFAGTATAETPFAGDGAYQGSPTAYAVRISRSSNLDIGSVGSVVFGDVFNSLAGLRDSLAGNDVSGIQDALGDLGDDFEHLSAQITKIGLKAKRLDMRTRIIQELEVGNLERLSVIEDADYAEAVMNLKSTEMAYQAALTSSAKVTQMSLANFI